MKKTCRKAMLSTMAMLLVGVMSLTGVTYAWFSTGNNADVTDFDVTVQSATGAFQIATTPKTGNLVFSSLATPDTSAYDGTVLVPVSAVNPNTNSALSFFTAQLSADNTKIASTAVPSAAVVAAGVSGQTAYYYTFDLYFYNPTGAEMDIYLAQDAAIKNADSVQTTEGSFLATRVGFTKYTPVALANGGDVVTNHKTITDTIIYEPSATTHTQAGINAGATANEVHTYLGVKADSTTGKTDPVYFSRTEADNTYSSQVSTMVDGAQTKTPIVSRLAGGGVVKVTVTVWLEGQDVDCLNSIAGKALNVDLLFTSKVTEAK